MVNGILIIFDVCAENFIFRVQFYNYGCMNYKLFQNMFWTKIWG